ncbi:hypothetical protein VdG2_08000 [Verticillium dahliae VDG2]|nr:hypothetical protein VdG2_08000 [Verticillium dahliae VDG2]
MASLPETNEAAGEPTSIKNQALLTGASATQNFAPLQNICAHLNAFHAYVSDPARVVEANHYCGHLNEDVRQCILYDSPEPTARIIGIEYMISPTLYETLEAEERKLWHSHVYEVKSGMLIMPQPTLPDAAWELAENKEMEEVPELMTSFTAPGQFDFEKFVGDRDQRFQSDYKRKEKAREGIKSPKVHPDADQAWKTQGKVRDDKGDLRE